MQRFDTFASPFEGLSRKELAVMPQAAASYAHALEVGAAQALLILSRMHPDAFYYQPVSGQMSQDVARAAVQKFQDTRAVSAHQEITGSETPVLSPAASPQYAPSVESLQQITGISPEEERAMEWAASSEYPAANNPERAAAIRAQIDTMELTA